MCQRYITIKLSGFRAGVDNFRAGLASKDLWNIIFLTFTLLPTVLCVVSYPSISSHLFKRTLCTIELRTALSLSPSHSDSVIHVDSRIIPHPKVERKKWGHQQASKERSEIE